jgi:4-hydroxyphenylpyruvate dioxygenase-like putative hemolysin
MTAPQESSRLHHVVFAVALERLSEVAQMYTELGFTLQPLELTELGLSGHLDWDRGIEIISPVPGSTSEVAVKVTEFLDTHGDGVYTVVIQIPDAAAAESVVQRYGATTRFEQGFEGDGFHLKEIDLSVLNLPITLLATNLP